MKEICLLIVLTHLAFPAFENAFKFQYLGSNLPNIQDSVQISQNKKSVSLIIPFGQPFLKLATLNYSKEFPFGNFGVYLASSGDNLYQEIMMESKFEFLLHPQYNLAGLLNTYLISIKNYSSHHSLSFRYSTQRKKGISEKWKPEMGFQLDIVF